MNAEEEDEVDEENDDQEEKDVNAEEVTICVFVTICNYYCELLTFCYYWCQVVVEEEEDASLQLQLILDPAKNDPRKSLGKGESM